MSQPTLETERLILRPYAPEDAQRLTELIGDWKIFDTTERIPHPYTVEMAQEFIATNLDRSEPGGHSAFGIESRSEGRLIGGTGLTINDINRRASLGYWIGVEYWGHGYTTETAREMLRYGFEDLGLNRIEAQFLKRNPASGRVMAKAGMRPEAEFPEYALKHGVFEDVVQYVLYASEFAVARDSVETR